VRVALTGTPGTGKSTATERLETGLHVIHLNEVIRERDLTAGRDTERDSAIADIDAAADWLDGRDDVIFESHLAHKFVADTVVVLRCHPEEIERRLRSRDESPASVAENAESEALDVILTEAVERHGTDSVHEIDTTDRQPSAVADEIAAAVDGRREPRAGTVSCIDYL
jgi:adenylate kinase